MFSRVLKPTPGVADEPSVREHASGFRVLVQVVVVGFALCCALIPLNPALLAAEPNSAEPREVAAVEFSTSPPSLRELGSPILKNTGSTNPGYTIRPIAPEVRLQFSVADERGRSITDLSVDDIRILDDHFAVRRIRQFSRAQDLPLQIGLLHDVVTLSRRPSHVKNRPRNCSSIKSCGRCRIGHS